MSPRLLRNARIAWRLARRLPVFAGLNVTDHCNLSCTFCQVWRQPAPAMDLAQLKVAVAGLARIGIQVVGITGGEPLLRTDLPDILALVDDAGMSSTLVTNGTVMNPSLLRALRNARGLAQVAVSIQSLRPEVFAALRGGARLDRALATVEALRQDGPDAVLKVNTHLSRANLDDVDPLLAFCRERGLHLTVTPSVLGHGFPHRGEGENLAPREGDREALRDTFLRLADLKRRGEPLWELPAFYELSARYVMGEPLGPCDAGRLFVDVRADGSLAPCIDQPPFAHLLDPARAPRDAADLARRRLAVAGTLDRCARETACCYTCTYALTTIADHLGAYVADYGRTALGRALRGPRHPR